MHDTDTKEKLQLLAALMQDTLTSLTSALQTVEAPQPGKILLQSDVDSIREAVASAYHQVQAIAERVKRLAEDL